MPPELTAEQRHFRGLLHEVTQVTHDGCCRCLPLSVECRKWWVL